MVIFILTLTGLAVIVLVVYLAIPVARHIKYKGRQGDVAEMMYPGDRERQSNFRDTIASEIIRKNPHLTYESQEFQDLYRREMDRLLREYQN